VVDLYAGFGYFTIPFIKGGASHVHTCEMNPNSIAALRRNLASNAVASSCTVCVNTPHTRAAQCPVPRASHSIAALRATAKWQHVALHALQTVSASLSCPLPTQACLWLWTLVLRERVGCMLVHSKACDPRARVYLRFVTSCTSLHA
jgi:hypothetical protein